MKTQAITDFNVNFEAAAFDDAFKSKDIFTKSPHERESNTVLDSGFHVVLAWIPVFAVELEFSILIVSYSSTPDSLSCITDSKAQDSGFHNEKFLRFQNPFSLSFFLFFI